MVHTRSKFAHRVTLIHTIAQLPVQELGGKIRETFTTREGKLKEYLMRVFGILVTLELVQSID